MTDTMPEVEATLRDRLALRRTSLANERTVLAYARTALMFVASGATLWRLAPIGTADPALGAFAIVLGIGVGAAGVRRFMRTRSELNAELTD